VMEVINQMNKYTIINLKQKGYSNRKIARELGIDRRTIGKIWNDYLEARTRLETNPGLPREEKEKLTQIITGNKPYDSSNRRRRKLTPEVQSRILCILEQEEIKTELLGKRHKQKLTASQIHQILNEEGVDIGLTSVTNFIRKARHQKEVFIRQNYEPGYRLEYDFGEVKLIINKKPINASLAVFCSPASGFRWAYLYSDQKQQVFLDSHVRFFEMTKGTWKEVVYDNMKNVVTRFIGRSEKEINPKLRDLALFYNFEINVTNCFSGHEKGSVEGTVKFIRNKVFASKYQFDSFLEAEKYLEEQLVKINQSSSFYKEQLHLRPCPFKYEIAEVLSVKVDKYSCVRVENNFYSVPDYLIDQYVTIKNYLKELTIYKNNEVIWTHQKVNGMQEYQLELSHYLKTLSRKPGALKNSQVLKQIPELHHIYHLYFKTKPKEFIEICQQHAGKTIDELVNHLLHPHQPKEDMVDEITMKSKDQLKQITQLFNLEGIYGNH
jgi:transposase